MEVSFYVFRHEASRRYEWCCVVVVPSRKQKSPALLQGLVRFALANILFYYRDFIGNNVVTRF